MESKNIVKLLKRRDNAAFQKIYNDNKEAFVNFAKKYHIEEYDSLDIYHDSIMVLQDNAIKGKINGLKSSISTYLFAIGKYKIFHLFRERAKVTISDEIEIVEKNFDFDVNFDGGNLTNQQTLLKKGLKKLGKRCISILELYYNGYDLDEITDILDYSNKNVLKSQKSRCMKQIKNIIFNHE